MFKLAPTVPEIPQFREADLSYPPIALITYLVNPFASPEALFMELVSLRVEIDPTKEIVLGSYGEDIENGLAVSSPLTALTSKFKEVLTKTNVHYRHYDTIDELLRSIELYYRNSDFMYYYMPYLKKEEDQAFVSKLVGLVKKIKSSSHRSLVISFFIDKDFLDTQDSKILLYHSDIVFELFSDEKMLSKYIRVLKRRNARAPPMIVEYTIEKDGIGFQIIRVY